jgi:predicted DNA binding protein
MAGRASIAYFEIEHFGCWTAIAKEYGVRIRTLGQEFLSPQLFRASVALMAKDLRDLRRFISVIKGFSSIARVNTNSISRAYSLDGERIRLALISFESLREGSISDLVYRVGGLILDQEIVEGVERWKILIPRSSKKVERYLEERLRSMGKLLRITFSGIDARVFCCDPRSLLNDNEKRAIELALNSGLLDYPKKARVADVAKLMGISPATFIYHLRRGEKKLISFTLSNKIH